MALSESEQRLLAQMEAALAAEDPKLVKTFSGPSARQLHPRRAALAGLGFVAGLGLLIGGMLTWPGLSVLGFVVMVASAVIGIYSWQPRPTESTATTKGAPTKPRPAPATKPEAAGDRPEFGQGFMDRMEERWRRRRDEDI